MKGDLVALPHDAVVAANVAAQYHPINRIIPIAGV